MRPPPESARGIDQPLATFAASGFHHGLAAVDDGCVRYFADATTRIEAIDR
jgi:hypothetical protein